MVKVVEVSDSGQQKTLRGHEAPVLSVTFDPKDDFLVGKAFALDGRNTTGEIVFCLCAGDYEEFGLKFAPIQTPKDG